MASSPDAFVHRFATFADQSGDIDLHLAGLLGPTEGLWDGLNLIRGRSGMIIPRPGLKSLSGMGRPWSTSDIWAGLSEPSKADGKVYAVFDGDVNVYEAIPQTSSSWSDTGDDTTGYDGPARILPLTNDANDGPLIAREITGGIAWRVALASAWSTVLSTAVDNSTYTFNPAEIVVHRNRIYGTNDESVTYSPTSWDTAWSDSFTPGLTDVLASAGGNVQNLVSHEQGLFIQVGNEVYLLSGTPEGAAADLRQVADRDSVISMCGEGRYLTAIGLDGAIYTWNGSTFEVVASQFKTLLSSWSFGSANSPVAGNDGTVFIPIVNPLGQEARFLLRHNGIWTQHQFTSADWVFASEGDTPTASLMKVYQGQVRSGLNYYTTGGLDDLFLVPAQIEESGNDRARLCCLAFGSSVLDIEVTEPYEPASGTTTVEADTTDPMGDFTCEMTLPTRWATPGKQFRIKRVVATVKRAGSTESGNNELTVQLTTYDRRGTTTPSATASNAFSETASAADLDFFVWDLKPEDLATGDAYRLQITNMVGVGLRHLEVFGDETDGYP